ncbi:hypothetical protein [Ralstonia solanacearum]|uniref:hypothetical protein n=1 Tax=Ralstonia solanacearum TaxID=305 RepID=UPI001E479ABC|nr:hypothetical protein [Ralstonia solanacearum]
MNSSSRAPLCGLGSISFELDNKGADLVVGLAGDSGANQRFYFVFGLYRRLCPALDGADKESASDVAIGAADAAGAAVTDFGQLKKAGAQLVCHHLAISKRRSPHEAGIKKAARRRLWWFVLPLRAGKRKNPPKRVSLGWTISSLPKSYMRL